MKKIFLSLIAAVACMSINAQVVKVYKNGALEATYANTTTDKYKVVFEEIKKVTGITISGSSTVTSTSTPIQLTATVSPEDATVKTVTWSSSNESIATVDQTGSVAYVADGEVTITATANDGSGVSATFTVTAGAGACLAAGTRITMADGTTKLIEDIAEGDMIQTFDHETGGLSSAKVCLAWKGKSKAQPLNLTFASGKTLSVVGTHDLLFEGTHKYIRINKGNAASFVGKRFYNAETGSWDILTGFAMDESVEFYCLYSAKHLNCVAEGMLTCPDDVDYCLNIYEMDANLKADPEQLSADIAKYGLLDIARDYPDYAQYKDQMEDLGCKYFYIAVGKGLVSMDTIETMKAYWNDK